MVLIIYALLHAYFMLRLVLKVDFNSCRATHSVEKISVGIRPEFKCSSINGFPYEFMSLCSSILGVSAQDSSEFITC